MRWLVVHLLVAFTLLELAGCGDKQSISAATYQHADWEMLLPEKWDPAAALRGMDFSQVKDSDPRAIKALQQVREVWKRAPIEPKMNGARIRISGYVTPLDSDLGHAREFLLVPYYGACIHTPPPPGNQIIHVVLRKPMSLAGWDSSVIVSGQLETVPSSTALGVAGYRMMADAIVPFASEMK